MMFRVIDTITQKPPDLEDLALNEEWARGLIYCDMAGFALLDDGTLILCDECGAYCIAPEGRFRVEWSK